jgi:hypothetical protein
LIVNYRGMWMKVIGRGGHKSGRDRRWGRQLWDEVERDKQDEAGGGGGGAIEDEAGGRSNGEWEWVKVERMGVQLEMWMRM